MKNEYLYAVARLKLHETKLLSDDDIRSLLEAGSPQEEDRILQKAGYTTQDRSDVHFMLKREEEKLWSFLREILPGLKPLRLFLEERDIMNLKTAMKQLFLQKPFDEKLYRKPSLKTPEEAFRLIKNQEFQDLDPSYREDVRAAFEALFRQGDVQLSDTTMDKLRMNRSMALAKESKNEILIQYANLKGALGNLRIVFRGLRMGRPLAFYQAALSDSPLLDRKRLLEAVKEGEGEVFSYLQHTRFRPGLKELEEDFALFERWCDNEVMALMLPERRRSMGLSPIVAYLLGKEREFEMVRLVLIGKKEGLDKEELRKRLRVLYG